MGIIAVAVFLAFLSVFVGDKREKKRLQNAAHKVNTGNDGIMAVAGMLLGGVGVDALDLSDDEYSDGNDDVGFDLGGAAAGGVAAAVSGFGRASARQLERTPPPLPSAGATKRYNIASIRELSAKTPPRVRQGTPPRTRSDTPPRGNSEVGASQKPRDVEYLSDEWYELYGKKAKRNEKHQQQQQQQQEIDMDAIEREAKLMAEQISFGQDECADFISNAVA
eukprot:COSAG02_NODE_4424_length_5376_cov_5.362138_3_plen_222_part_00